VRDGPGRGLDPAECWRRVLERDPTADGAFVYAVRTTGVYCRPSCPSRRPRRERVLFFASPEEAERAGFRPCRRCRPGEAVSPWARLVEAVCRRLAEDPALPLSALAEGLGVRAERVRRAFRRVLGVSPREYRSALRQERFRTALRAGEGVASALYGAGYGSPSRVYGREGAPLGMTPARYRKGGEGLTVRYALAETWLGWLLVAVTERGVCAVRLGDGPEALREDLRREFPRARLEEDGAGLEPVLSAVRARLEAPPPHPDLPLDLRATAFQARVWALLRSIPYGERWTYRQVAEALGQPGAVRAVARACASNPVALLVPCHRVVRSDGSPGGYRWGPERKEALLEEEARRASATPPGQDASRPSSPPGPPPPASGQSYRGSRKRR